MSEKYFPKAIINIFKQDRSIEENTKSRNQIGRERARERERERSLQSSFDEWHCKTENDLINLKRLRSDHTAA